MSDTKLIGVIDSGTNSVKFAVFNIPHLEELCSHEIKIKQITLHKGYFEQDPLEIINAIRECAKVAVHLLPNYGLSKANIACIGITNQRETTVMWNKKTGEPLHNAIVWNDTRTSSTVDEILSKLGVDIDHFRELTGLPISTLATALKIRWLRKFVPAVREAIRDGTALAGTVDSWIVFNLIRGLHVTDCTNASRTLLMNLSTLQWDQTLLKSFSIDENILPEIRSSSEIIGKINDGSFLNGIAISAMIGNQQASLLGQLCFQTGQAKCTYRSGCFLLCNIGHKPVYSHHGLVTTVGYRFGKNRPIYALEGNISIAGAALKWLKTNLGILPDADDSERLASLVPTTADCYFVPAFRGLFAPYYQKEARGVICGLTAFTTKNHIIRAALETSCYQVTDIIEAMKQDAGIHLRKLYVDGKMTENNLLLQLQSDISGVPILRSQTKDTTSLGAAIAAGHAEGIDLIDLKPENRFDNIKIHHDTFLPSVTEADRRARIKKWKMAIERSYGWVSIKEDPTMTSKFISQTSINGMLNGKLLR